MVDWSSTLRDAHNHNLSYECNYFQGEAESVSSTDDLPGDADMHAPSEMVPSKSNDAVSTVGIQKALHKTKLQLVFGFSCVLIAMVTPLLWINVQDEHCLVPT